jgi:PAS domain S-box-containing protein
VVTDDVAQRAVIEAALASLPVQVIDARTLPIEPGRADALAALVLDARVLDARVLDARVLDAVAEIARLPADALPVSIVLVTADELDAEAQRRMVDAGVLDFLTAPIDPARLRARIAASLALWERAETLRLREEELRQAEDALARARVHALHADARAAVLDALLQTAPIGIAYFDTAMRFQVVNEALAQMNQTPREDHLGRTLADVLPPVPASAKVVALLERALRTREPASDQDVEWIDATGRVRHAVVSFFPVEIAGELTGAAVTVVDITDRYEARADADAQRELLQATFAQARARLRAREPSLPARVWTERRRRAQSA